MAHHNLLIVILAVVRCQSEADVDATEVVEADDLGIVGDETQVLGDGTFSPAPGVETICIFPKNAAKCEYYFHKTLKIVNIECIVITVVVTITVTYDHYDYTTTVVVVVVIVIVYDANQFFITSSFLFFSFSDCSGSSRGGD